MKKLDHLKISDDRSSLKKFRVPLKTNVFISNSPSGVLIEETRKKIFEELINLDAKVITEINDIKHNEYVIIYSTYKNSQYLVDEFFGG